MTCKKTQAFIFSIFLLLSATVPTYAAVATFSWAANAEPVSGYKIHYGKNSRNYSFIMDVGLPEAVNGENVASIDGLQEGYTYYFAATAYSATEESDYSVEVVYTVPGTVSSESAISENATDINVDSNVESSTLLSNETTSSPAFELGELPVTSDWQRVNFSYEFSSPPSLVAKATTMNDPETGLVNIRNLTSQGFEIRIQEWDHLDGLHPEELVSFLAMERGRHQIADNVFAIAECTNISDLNAYEPVTFVNALPSQPVVLSSIVTNNEPNATTVRMKDISSQGFSITMQEQESNDWNHTEETVCFIAMEKWSGVVGDLMFEIGSTPNTLTDAGATIFFIQQSPTIPFFLTDMQTANDMDTAILGISNLSATETGMTIIEEHSADSEVSHLSEIGGYLAITPFNPEKDNYNIFIYNIPDETQTNPKHLGATTMSSIISMFDDLIN